MTSAKNLTLAPLAGIHGLPVFFLTKKTTTNLVSHVAQASLELDI